MNPSSVTLLQPGLHVMSILRLPAKLALLGGLFIGGAAGLALAFTAWPEGAAHRTAIGLASLAFVVWAYLAASFCVGCIGGLARAVQQMERIERGELGAVGVAATGSDEVAQLERSMARMTARLSSLVAEVRSNSALVAQAGNKLVRSYGDLAGRTEEQAASLQRTSASVQQLVSTVQQNASNAAEADARAGEVRSAAEQGARAMDEAVGTVGAIETDTHDIRAMMAVIDDIAFQTNILALNAAVEAARAGDQGRGFAVVASEVRRLAQRCADESRKIRELINASAEHVESGVDRIRAAGDGIAGVAEGVRLVAQRMSQISSASAEQSNGLGEIAAAVSQLDAITQRNAHMVEEAANQATYLKERAALLSHSVAHFRLPQGTASEALALVERAQAGFEGRSREAFLRFVTDPANRFHDRDLYVFALDAQGTYLAFAGNPGKVGTRVHDVPGVDGAALVQAIRAQADVEPGWVEYTISNPLAGTLQAKMSYTVKVGDVYLGCGVYKAPAALAIAA